MLQFAIGTYRSCLLRLFVGIPLDHVKDIILNLEESYPSDLMQADLSLGFCTLHTFFTVTSSQTNVRIRLKYR